MKFLDAINEAPTLTLASAATVNIGVAAANTLNISGTTTVTAFDTISAGVKRTLIFSGVLTLTYNATSMQLLTAANIVTAAGDIALVMSLGGGNWQMLDYTRATGVALVSSGGGSLADFTDSLSTAAPNGTVPVAALTATNAATNVDAVFAPKGTGALTARIADSTSTGGNKRGANALDLQTSISSAAQVASGSYSVALGSRNTASGLQAVAIGYSNTSSNTSTTAIGSGNQATNFYSVAMGQTCTSSGNTSVAMGYVCTASGSMSVAIGDTCTASGTDSVSFGVNNTAGGAASIVVGGQYGTTRGITGASAWGSYGAALGQTQSQQFLLRADTAGATPTRLTETGGAAASNNGPVMPNTSTYYCRTRVLARNTTNGDSASWSTTALIHREANAASTVLIGTPVITSDYASASLTTCVVAITADTTLGGLAVTVTGIAATNIRWVAHVETLETTN